MTFWDYLSTDENVDVPREEILNILRETSDPVLGTQEIADLIDMSRQGAEDRLKTIEEEGHIQSKKIGDNWVWDLHPDERREPINPEIDRMVRLFDRVRAIMEPTMRLGGVVLISGFVLQYMGITGVLVNLQNPVIGNDLLTIIGWGTVITGALTWLVGGLVINGTQGLEWLALWKLNRNQMQETSPDTLPDGGSRGQVWIRWVFIGFVLLVVAVPLIRAGLRIQSGLASGPTFSPVEAAMIAVALIGMIVAAILGAGNGR